MKIFANIKNVREVVLWFSIFLITVLAGFTSYYFYFTAPVKTIIWIIWFLFFTILGYFTSKGKQIFLFIKNSKIELYKVVWPTRQETIQTTSIVMIMVSVTGFVLWGVDSIMMWIIAKLAHLG